MPLLSRARPKRTAAGGSSETRQGGGRGASNRTSGWGPHGRHLHPHSWSDRQELANLPQLWRLRLPRRLSGGTNRRRQWVAPPGRQLVARPAVDALHCSGKPAARPEGRENCAGARASPTDANRPARRLFSRLTTICSSRSGQRFPHMPAAAGRRCVCRYLGFDELVHTHMESGASWLGLRVGWGCSKSQPCCCACSCR